MAWLILAFVGIGVVLLVSEVPAADASLGGDLTQAGSPPMNTGEITNDFTTWPGGDRIWDICHAIALAEGANVPGSNPDRLNNPGDLSDGFSTFGGEVHSGSNVTHFPDKNTGWQWLYNKVSNIANGTSQVYDPNWTWNQIAKTWAQDSKNWARNVCTFLGVDPQSTLKQYTG